MYVRLFKSSLDKAVAFSSLIILSPMLIVIALVVWQKMGSPVIFCQQRTGLGKIPFKIYKFKTMIDDKSNTLSDYERITSIGYYLRKFSLDELPQLINVLKGDMSIVGPRPLLVEYDQHYSKEQNHRFTVKPGITGLAQVSGRNTLSWEEKFDLDVFYSNSVSFFLDVKIIFKTIIIIICADGFMPSGEEKKFNDKNS